MFFFKISFSALKGVPRLTRGFPFVLIAWIARGARFFSPGSNRINNKNVLYKLITFGFKYFLIICVKVSDFVGGYFMDTLL